MNPRRIFVSIFLALLGLISNPIFLHPSQSAISQAEELTEINCSLSEYSISSDSLNGGPDGTVLFLQVDDAIGSAKYVDSSSYANDGLCTSSYCPLNGVAGVVNSSVLFDGVDDFIQTSTNSFPTGNSNRTLAVWAKFYTIHPSGTYSFIAGYGTYGDLDKLYVLMLNGPQLYFTQYGAALAAPEPIETGKWYHFAVTNIGNEATLYVNGVAVETGSLPINTPNGSNFYLGKLANWDEAPIHGQIDEIFVVNRALNSQEILILFNKEYYNIFLPLVAK